MIRTDFRLHRKTSALYRNLGTLFSYPMLTRLTTAKFLVIIGAIRNNSVEKVFYIFEAFYVFLEFKSHKIIIK